MFSFLWLPSSNLFIVKQIVDVVYVLQTFILFLKKII